MNLLRKKNNLVSRFQKGFKVCEVVPTVLHRDFWEGRDYFWVGIIREVSASHT